MGQREVEGEKRGKGGRKRKGRILCSCFFSFGETLATWIKKRWGQRVQRWGRNARYLAALTTDDDLHSSQATIACRPAGSDARRVRFSRWSNQIASALALRSL